jgi:phosphoribosyl 1,2-cyclic phosphate phosphodiesterase
MAVLTFLGTGTSNGVPIIGCACATCTSSDPRDERGRSSAFVRWRGATYLIDTATELRLQARATGLSAIDAVLMTHAHADHTGGFDDLRRFNELQQRRLPVYAGSETARILGSRYAYAFDQLFPFFGGKPDLDLHEIDGPFSPLGETIIPIPVIHGRALVYGYRFGDLAYITDAKIVSDEAIELVRGVDTLVLNALRERPHPTHLSFSEAVEIAGKIGARQVFLTHLSHETTHADAEAPLPAHIRVAYDGLTITSREG